MADTRIPEQAIDAVRVILEHSEGPVMTVLLTYARRRLGGVLEFGSVQATTADHYIW